MVVVDQSANSPRLFVKDKSGSVDEIAANIHQPTAAIFEDIANILRIAIKVAKTTYHRSDFANAFLPDELENLAPLRMRANHEGFTDSHAGAISCLEQGSSLLDRQADRLLAKHMLSCFGSLY